MHFNNPKRIFNHDYALATRYLTVSWFAWSFSYYWQLRMIWCCFCRLRLFVKSWFNLYHLRCWYLTKGVITNQFLDKDPSPQTWAKCATLHCRHLFTHFLIRNCFVHSHFNPLRFTCCSNSWTRVRPTRVFFYLLPLCLTFFALNWISHLGLII